MSENKPILWISLGPTGSGKSYITKKLISVLYPKDNDTSIKECYLDNLIEEDPLYQKINSMLIRKHFNLKTASPVNASQDSASQDSASPNSASPNNASSDNASSVTTTPITTSPNNPLLQLFLNIFPNNVYQTPINQRTVDDNIVALFNSKEYKDFLEDQQKLYYLIRQIDQNYSNGESDYQKLKILVENLSSPKSILGLTREKYKTNFPKPGVSSQDETEATFDIKSLLIRNFSKYLIRLPWPEAMDVTNNHYKQNDVNIQEALNNTSIKHVILESTGQDDLHWLFDSSDKTAELIVQKIKEGMEIKFVAPYIGDNFDTYDSLKFLDFNTESETSMAKSGIKTNLQRLFEKIYDKTTGSLHDKHVEARSTPIVGEEVGGIKIDNYFNKYKESLVVYKNIKETIETCISKDCESPILNVLKLDLKKIPYKNQQETLNLLGKNATGDKQVFSAVASEIIRNMEKIDDQHGAINLASQKFCFYIVNNSINKRELPEGRESKLKELNQYNFADLVIVKGKLDSCDKPSVSSLGGGLRRSRTHTRRKRSLRTQTHTRRKRSFRRRSVRNRSLRKIRTRRSRNTKKKIRRYRS